MSNRKPPLRLLTFAEFLSENPSISKRQLEWAIRNRNTNGLAAHVYKRAYGTAFFVDATPAREFFTAMVKA